LSVIRFSQRVVLAGRRVLLFVLFASTTSTMLSIGSILYVSLLLTNAVAILNEERFLARIGWSSVQPQVANQAYNQSYGQSYDQSGYGNPVDAGVKGRLINLISAVRTLMRIPLIALNLIVIVYELILGG